MSEEDFVCMVCGTKNNLTWKAYYEGRIYVLCKKCEEKWINFYEKHAYEIHSSSFVERWYKCLQMFLEKYKSVRLIFT